jgi:hypothetical protein
MRSLTHSSAGISAPVLPISTTPPYQGPSHTTPSLQPQPNGLQATTHVNKHTGAKPSPPTQHPFFKVNNTSSLLSTHAKINIDQAIQNSWAKSTVNRYSSAIHLFLQFCDSEQIPDHFRFPADEFVLCAFAASNIGKHGASTARSRLSALKAWHVVHNIEWKGSPRLRYILNGVVAVHILCSLFVIVAYQSISVSPAPAAAAGSSSSSSSSSPEGRFPVGAPPTGYY